MIQPGWSAAAAPEVSAPVESTAPATSQAPVVPTIGDVALAEGNTLWGEVVGTDGKAIDGAMVRIAQSGRSASTVSTSEDGLFAVPNMRPGVYEIGTGTTNGVYRIWSPGTAPPAAVPSVRMVAEQDIVRAQREFGSWLKENKFIIGGIMAAAIAIPIAVHNNRLDRGTTSP